MEISRNQTRQSGVELLKILGMFLIVIGHVTQTLDITNANVNVPFSDYSLGDIAAVTENPARLLMGGLMYGGALGNNIFFFCSAWFLLDKKEGSVRKIPRLMSDVWAISVLMLLAFLMCLRGDIDASLALGQLFPNIRGNNWYLTAYMLFLPMYPALNEIIRRCDRKSLFYALAFLVALTAYYRHILCQWVMFYFLIAYMKRYLEGFSFSVKKNLVLLALSVSGIAVSIITFNALGLRYAFLAGILPRLRQMYNPFVILTAISLLNLARQIPIQSRAVNYVARMTMFIYLIHQNMLVRNYLRPWIWQKIYIWGGVQPHYFVHFHLLRRAFPVLSRVKRPLCGFPTENRAAHERRAVFPDIPYLGET